jgi:hypothetical protein
MSWLTDAAVAHGDGMKEVLFGSIVLIWVLWKELGDTPTSGPNFCLGLFFALCLYKEKFVLAIAKSVYEKVKQYARNQDDNNDGPSDGDDESVSEKSSDT